MGDAQSAQREGKKDAAAEEQSGKVDDALTEETIGDEPPKNKGPISEINGKADGSRAEVNGHCEDDIAVDKDVLETEKPPQEEETPLNVEINEKESPNKADANEDASLEKIEIDAKQNDINDSFRRFFSNIGLKLTVKRDSSEIATDVPDETNKEEPNRPEGVEDTAKETTSESAEQNTDVNIAQEMYDNDSTTCPTLTDGTSENVQENAEEKTTETKDEVESDNVDAARTSPVGADAHMDATPEEEPHSTSPSIPEEVEVVSPIKRFFTTGIFSGLRKKKKPAEDETNDKELDDKGEKEVKEATEQTVQDQQDKEEISLGVEVAAIETENKENKHKAEILSAASAQTMDASTIDPSIIIVTEPEILNSQEKDKVQASPLKRLLSGSSLKKLSKKQRGRKSSDAKLSDSGEHVSDQLLSSTESAENQKEEGSAQPSAEEDGAWASFKKLVTPKKHMKRSSLSNEETQIPGSVEEQKPSEGGQISDHSTEEGKKQKDSSVSWESVLCGSGRRRSRKTSDSEDETPQIDNDINKQGGVSKHGTESVLESSNEVDEIIAYSPKQAGSPSEGDGGSTWKSLKRLVTPKRKVKDEDENKDNVQSDSEVTQDETSFSIKKLLPGRKKRKSTEKQDQVSSDEADKEIASGDEDSETPAVVPLSEFETIEKEVHMQTQTAVESHIPKEADYELQQDLLDQMAEPVLPCDNLQTEAKKVQDNDDALENQASTTPATNEELDDLTESISKQQLSDIPEEATPASATEEAARDDTMAEDLIEISSEAITAPEPLDITLGDETEMISALSQLSSESSKTSGNTTPVPTEHDFIETDLLLHQVVETISISPKTVPVCSDEPRTERPVVSVSHQILEKFVKEEPTILEIHRGLDGTAIHTGLNVQELDAITALAATTQTESISEVNDSFSTEIVSEIPTEEFDTAEIAVDEVHDVKVTHQEDSIKELESIDESHDLVECLSEQNVVVFTDILPEGIEIVPDEDSLVKAHQAKTKTPKIDSQEADSTATVADEAKDGAMEQDVQTLTEKADQIMHNITDQIQVEDINQEAISEDIPAVETVTYELKEETLTEVKAEPEKEDAAETEHGKVPEALDAVQASTLVQSPEEEVKSADIPPAETVTDKPKQTEEHLTQISAEPENKDIKANAVQTEHVQESEAVQALTLDSEEGSGQSLEKEVISENVPEAATDTGELKEETIPLTEEKLESEDASKTEHVQEVEEVLEAVIAPTLDPEEGSGQSLEKEFISEDSPEVGTVTDELKEEILLLTDLKLEQEDASKTEHVQELEEVSEAVQAPTLDPEEGSGQSLEKEVLSEDSTEVETVTDEPKEETIPLTEEKLEQEDASKSEHVQELKEVLEAVQAPTLDPEEGSGQSLEKEVLSEDSPEVETVTDEPKEETLLLTDLKLEQLDADKTEHVQEPELLQAVQAATLHSEAGSLLSLEMEVISDDIPAVETVADEPKQESEVRMEPEEILPVEAAKTEHVQEPEESQAVQAATLDSEVDSCPSLDKEVISEDIPAVETITDEPKQETEVRVKPEEILPEDAPKTEHVQEPELLQAVKELTLDAEAGSLPSLEKEVISEDIPAVETVADEPKQETEVRVEPEEILPEDAPKTEHVQEPEVSQAVQAATLDSEVDSCPSLDKEVISEDIPAVETITDEPKQETEVRVKPEEILPEDAPKTEHVQEPELLQAVKELTLDAEAGSLPSLEKEVMSEDIPAVETVADESKQETEVRVEPEEIPPEDAPKTEHVQEPEVSQAVQAATLDSEVDSCLSLEKEVISEDIPAVETITDEPKQETEVRVEPEEILPEDAPKTEHVQEPELLQAVKAATLDSEVDSCLSLEKEVMSEDIPAVETITDEPKQETEVRVEPGEILPEDPPKTEHVQVPEVSQAVQAATLDSEVDNCPSLEKEVVSEDIPAVETITDEPKQETEVRMEPEEIVPVEATKTEYVCVCVNGEENNVQVLEKTVFPQETLAPCLDNAVVTDEPIHEVNCSAVQVSVEVEKENEHQGTEIATVEHALVAQVVTCYFKDVSARISDVLIDKTSAITEPLIDSVTSELVLKEEVDTVLEVGVTETNEVIDVFHETLKKVDNLSASPDIEEELINEENKVTIQEVIQHIKENLPEAVPESMVVNLEQEVIKQPDALTEVSEMAESESNEVEDQKVMEDNNASFKDRLDEATAAISVVSATEQQVSEDLTQTPDIPEDLKETKAKAGVAAEDVKPSAEELDVKKSNEDAPITHIVQSPIITPINTELAVPQNTGIISSVGNVEPPSSLSFEFKLNIQFGQAKAASRPPMIERNEHVKKSEETESVRPINPTQRAESPKQTELKEVAVQATDITEPVTNLDSTDIPAITTSPVMLDICIQAMETVEQIKSTEKVTSSIQATEAIQPVRPTEKREVLLSQPVISEAWDQETKAKEPVKQKEEENEQDVWMDAEEDICTKEETEVSLHKVEESLESGIESEQVEKAELEHEVEMAPNSKTEEEESQQEMHKTVEPCGIDSEGEDFAVALEHPDSATASITTME